MMPVSPKHLMVLVLILLGLSVHQMSGSPTTDPVNRDVDACLEICKLERQTCVKVAMNFPPEKRKYALLRCNNSFTTCSMLCL